MSELKSKKSNKTKSTIKSKSQLKKEKDNEYKYQVGSIVKYIGGLFDQYKNQEGKIIKKSNSKGKRYYTIDFNDKQMVFDENLLQYVKTLPMEGQIIIDDIENMNENNNINNKTEEIENENN